MVKKVIGIVLILLGLLALVTPLTPGAWLIFIGLELIGIRFVFDHKNGWGKWAAKLGIKSRTNDDAPSSSDTSPPPPNS